MHQFRQPNSREENIHFDVECTGNTVSIYARLAASDQEDDEIIRFEVAQRTIGRSIINAFYDCNKPCFARMFYTMWTKLAIGFRAPFAGKALKKLHELE